MTSFSAVILTEAADFLVEKEEDVKMQEKGIEIRKPYAVTEEEVAHKVQAESIFIPYATLQNIQHGDFEYETTE